MVAEKQTLLSKLHSFEKKEEPKVFENKEENLDNDEADRLAPVAKKIQVMEPPKPPPKKVEVWVNILTPLHHTFVYFIKLIRVSYLSHDLITGD